MQAWDGTPLGIEARELNGHTQNVWARRRGQGGEVCGVWVTDYRIKAVRRKSNCDGNSVRKGLKIRSEIGKGQLPVEFHFRMSVHFGPVYFFWDEGRNDWNYIGAGINGGQRVLAAIGKDLDDVVYVSDDLVQRLRAGDQYVYSAEPDFEGPDETPPEESVTLTEPRKEGSSLAKIIIDHLDNKGRKDDKHGGKWRVYQLNHMRLLSAIEESKVKRLITK